MLEIFLKQGVVGGNDRQFIAFCCLATGVVGNKRGLDVNQITAALNFLLDRTVLTDESKSLLPVVLETMRARKPTEITVFGHADASGSEERNFKLSAERAKFVADLLRKHDPTLDKIDVQSFGDKVPLVPSDTRAAEPRNRRAEIVIL